MTLPFQDDPAAFQRIPAEPPLSSGVSLYLHIPFCRTRCTYCAFNTYTGLDAIIPSYVAALAAEMRMVAGAAPASLPAAHTLYFGGGTPSLLHPDQAAFLIETARAAFALSPVAEITLEANPGTVDAARLRAFRAAGVNRLSIGVQSAHPTELAMFGRDHTFEQAARVFHSARDAGFDNLSLDLIYGAPGQTRDSWRRTLEAVLAWEPAHISLYSLTLEPGTRLAWQVEQHQYPYPDPDLAADMYEDARSLMAGASLLQYEISNWARPGYQCVHNRQYWLNEPFLGFGAGAHGFAAAVRYWNVKPIREYVSRVQAAEGRDFPLSPAVDGFDRIDPEMALAEALILNLRLVAEGVDMRRFQAAYGLSPFDRYGRELALLQSLGLLSSDGERFRLSERAYLISNQVFSRLIPDR